MATKKIFFNLKWIPDDMPDEMAIQLFRAIKHYIETGEALEVSVYTKYLFSYIKSEIDEHKQKQIAISEKRRLAGKKSAEKRWGKKLPKAAEPEFPFAECQTEEKGSAPVESPQEKVVVCELPEDKSLPAGTKNRTRNFVPPTVEEVAQYCQTRHNFVDAQQFVDFYTGKNWMIGKNKMADWRAAVRTWERSSSNSANAQRGQPPERPKNFTERLQDTTREVIGMLNASRQPQPSESDYTKIT
jgi:hypothetical protein